MHTSISLSIFDVYTVLIETGTEFNRPKIVSRGKCCVLNLINDNNPFFMNFYFLDNRHSSVLRTAFRRRVSTRMPSSYILKKLEKSRAIFKKILSILIFSRFKKILSQIYEHNISENDVDLL